MSDTRRGVEVEEMENQTSARSKLYELRAIFEEGAFERGIIELAFQKEILLQNIFPGNSSLWNYAENFQRRY